MLRDDEWFLSDLARELEMPRDTLHSWRRVGWVRARKLPVAGGPWVLWADAEELDAVAATAADAAGLVGGSGGADAVDTTQGATR